MDGNKLLKTFVNTGNIKQTRRGAIDLENCV
jgi:hypothetical protein